nr:reverse transcriptase domain-containing protein [Tanacetum cinerariifolium]
MQTRSSSRLISDQSSNPTSSTNPNPKGQNRRRSKKRIENYNLEEQSHPIVTMTDNRTMAELLRAPTEGYAEAIVVPLILAEQFELKRSLINMMTTDQFFGLEKDNPYDHIRWGSPLVARKRTPPDQDSLNAAAGRNLLKRKIAKITHAVNQQTNVVTTSMTAILKQFQATPPPALVKAVEETCVTCEGAHLYYQFLAAGGNTFLEFKDNIQGYVAAVAVNYNQGNPGYHPPDEQWFDLTKDTLREALQITPVDKNQAFIYAPASDALINFVNELGYPKLERRVGLKDQGLLCCRFFGASSHEPILIML